MTTTIPTTDKTATMMIRLFIFFCSATILSAQGVELTTPIDGNEGTDFFIVNYVDQEPESPGIKDYQCGTKTYDGHQGTDFTLRSFAQMDSGVAILAAADGVVFQVIDSLFDRNKESVVERGFGNWIGVAHDGGWLTFYAHLRTNSALVKPGDSIKAGQQIGLVGSSGNSSDPHLHFEVWKVDTVLHDPFGPGPCGARPFSLWKDQPLYDTEYRIIDYGLLDYVPTLDTLRERPEPPSSFATPDSVVSFWIHQLGIREGDRIRIEWRRMVDNQLWFEYEFPAEEQNWWYHYFWTYINLPPSDEYVVRYFINNQQIVEQVFEVDGSVSIKEDEPKRGISLRYLPGEWNIISIEREENSVEHLEIRLFDLTGKEVALLHSGKVGKNRVLLDLAPFHLSTGTYLLHITGEKQESYSVPIIQVR